MVTTHPRADGIRLDVTSGRRTTSLTYGTDFAVMRAGRTTITGELVPVPDLGDTAAIRGRIPVLRLPPGPWSAPAHAATAAARRAGARGLVLVLDSLEKIPPLAERALSMDHAAIGVPTVMLATAAAERALPGPSLAGATLTLAIPESADTASAPHVLGLLPGSDPRHRDEYVVMVAHLDHLGVGAPDERGDSIYNGADDNASGVAAVLEAARALARARPAPRRSVLFLVTSGEERGLLGSEYFTRRPPVPLARIVAAVNLDGIGRSWQADTVSAEGSAYSSLGETVRRMGRHHPELELTIVDDQWPDRNYFTTSDQIWFARRGVPAIFLSSTGPDAHYHRPSDEAATIEPSITARIARLAAWTVLDLGDSAERPRWDEAARRSIAVDR
jgi:hypothetical protein